MMARNSTERLVVTWSRENSLFPAHRRNGQPTFHRLQGWYYADFKGVEIRSIPRTDVLVQQYITSRRLVLRELFVLSCIRTCDFRKKLASPNLRIELIALAASVVLSERVAPESSRSSYSRRLFELGRAISLTTARPFDYHNSRLI